MKRIKCSLFLGILFLAVFSGCNKEKDKTEEQELLPISQEAFTYEISDGVSCFTVDENGLLYTAEYAAYEKEDAPDVFENIEDAEAYMNAAKGTQIIKVYDLEGNCVQQENVEIGFLSIECMTIQEGTIYCVVLNARMVQTVYCIDTTTWEATKLAELEEYRTISRLIPLDDYLYVLGKSNEVTEYGYALHSSVYAYNYDGERICRIQLNSEETKTERLKVSYPIDMYVTENETLMIYQYTEEKGFGFLELNPKKETVIEQEWSHGETRRMYMCACAEGYLYIDNARITYGTTEGKKVQLLPDKMTYMDCLQYQKGFVFYREHANSSSIERVCVANIVKDNKEIRFMMHEYAMDVPYGYGYQMTELVYESEEFALKVLAGDSDYDMYLLASREDIAYNLKKNGAFYALNDVPGVQEYLDACFPYLKELATNEDGDIWMLPVAMAIPGLIYNKEYCAENGVDYSQMDLMEFYNFTVESERINPELTTISYVNAAEEFFMQYLSQYDTFDTEVFRSYIELLKNIWQEQGASWGTYEALDKGLLNHELADFYYHHERYETSMLRYAERIPDVSKVGIAALPKMTEDAANLGTVTFLAVNPKSDNLGATLAYISDLAEYLMTEKDAFMLADRTMYTDTPYIQDMYDLYANGSVDFRMNNEVYLEVFNSYLKGEIGLEEAIAEAERKWKIYMGE